ncbi:MAG TPA: hypothetical protein V6D20_00355 [Candidatus Obscuribacterales bacterium]
MSQSRFTSELLLSAATVPVLLGIMGGKLMADVMLSVGQASEELFRGDRLPVLHRTTPPPSES